MVEWSRSTHTRPVSQLAECAARLCTRAPPQRLQANERRKYLAQLHREGKAFNDVLSGWWLSVLALARAPRRLARLCARVAWDAWEGFQY